MAMHAAGGHPLSLADFSESRPIPVLSQIAADPLKHLLLPVGQPLE
jgi:hypothetical protein